MATHKIMALLAAVGTLLASPSRSSAADIAVPGGTLRPPAGCVGQVYAGIDDVTGTLYCRSRELVISVSAGMFEPCAAPAGSAESATPYIPTRVDLKARDGSGLCISQRTVNGRMEVSIGLARSGYMFRANVTDGADVLVLLATAASYRASGATEP
jgi:hypothetical protein